MQVQRVGVLQCAGAADERDLHAAAEAGVEAKHTLLARGRRQQQLLEVATEDDDRFLVGPRLQLQPQLHLDAGGKQTVVRVLGDLPKNRRSLARTDHVALQLRHDVDDRRVHGPHQLTFRLAAADGQHAVRRNGAE